MVQPRTVFTTARTQLVEKVKHGWAIAPVPARVEPASLVCEGSRKRTANPRWGNNKGEIRAGRRDYGLVYIIATRAH